MIKWLAASACLLILLGWALSVRYDVDVGNDKVLLMLTSGRLFIFGPAPNAPMGPVELRWYEAWSGFGLTWPYIGTNPYWGREYMFPAWLILLIALVPTALLWWLDRRRPSLGHCQKCGYDLTGNVSGRCPECGTPTKPEGQTG